jgi:hypothetical protein
MNKINDGGPAYPALYEGSTRPDAMGMTLRDYFAAKAMQGFSTTVRDLGGANDAIARGEFDTCARFAYLLADAMLAARGAQ